MKNAMQLKAIMRNMAKEKKVSAQLLLQNYMMERLLERVGQSRYSSNFIIKGGFLIAAMVGLDTRATMDIDATIKGYPVEEETIHQMFLDICSISIEDDISFEFRHIEEIREGDDYTGYRVSLTANYPPMAVPLKLDITTGDVITPREIEFKYKLMMEDRTIPILAYNLETVVAEKLEAVISRSDQSTRPRDYYDVFILTKLKENEIDLERLRAALAATSKKRGSTEILKDYRAIMAVVQDSEIMQKQWLKYQKDFAYTDGITFNDTCRAVIAAMEKVGEF